MKNIVQKIITIVLGAVTFLSLTLNFVTETSSIIGAGNVGSRHHSFTDWFDFIDDIAEGLELTWMPIAKYVCYAALVLAIIMVIMALIQILIRNKLANSLISLFGVLAIVVGIAALVTLFVGVNEINDITDIVILKAEYSLNIGAYILAIGTIGAGIFGLLSTNKLGRKYRR